MFLAIQVAHVAGPVDSAMGGGLLSGVVLVIAQLGNFLFNSHLRPNSHNGYTSKWCVIGFHCYRQLQVGCPVKGDS